MVGHSAWWFPSQFSLTRLLQQQHDPMSTSRSSNYIIAYEFSIRCRWCRFMTVFEKFPLQTSKLQFLFRIRNNVFSIIQIHLAITINRTIGKLQNEIHIVDYCFVAFIDFVTCLLCLSNIFLHSKKVSSIIQVNIFNNNDTWNNRIK